MKMKWIIFIIISLIAAVICIADMNLNQNMNLDAMVVMKNPGARIIHEREGLYDNIIRYSSYQTNSIFGDHKTKSTIWVNNTLRKANIRQFDLIIFQNVANVSIKTNNITWYHTIPNIADNTAQNDLFYIYTDEGSSNHQMKIWEFNRSGKLIYQNVDDSSFEKGLGIEIPPGNTSFEMNPPVYIEGLTTFYSEIRFNDTVTVYGDNSTGVFIPYWGVSGYSMNLNEIVALPFWKETTIYIKNYSIGDWVYNNNTIYKCNTDGAQTGNFSDHTDKWDELISSYHVGNTTVIGSTNTTNKSIADEFCFHDGDCMKPKYRTKARKTDNQTITNGEIWHNITWDAEDFDVGNMHSIATDNVTINIKRTNLYSLGYHLKIESQDKTKYEVRVLKNGLILETSCDMCVGSKYASFVTLNSADNSFEFNAGDNITIQINHDDIGGSMDMQASNCYFQIKEEY